VRIVGPQLGRVAGIEWASIWEATGGCRSREISGFVHRVARDRVSQHAPERGICSSEPCVDDFSGRGLLPRRRNCAANHIGEEVEERRDHDVGANRAHCG
jgi:hypothetical protein